MIHGSQQEKSVRVQKNVDGIAFPEVPICCFVTVVFACVPAFLGFLSFLGFLDFLGFFLSLLKKSLRAARGKELELETSPARPVGPTPESAVVGRISGALG